MITTGNRPPTKQRVDQIEGLRAVCVLLVLIFHVDEKWLPSGYLGVDAFFAVSGYVITRMIAAQKAVNVFSFFEFYRSRAVRLLPAMLVVVLVSEIVFLGLYGVDDLKAFLHSAIAATLSASNIYFFLDAGYFSASSVYKPLLHTWSLGVEEQFYLIWPLALALLARAGWLRTQVFLLLFAMFLPATLAFSVINADATFFLTPFRMYQFFAGGAFALLSGESYLRFPPLLKSLIPYLVVGAMIALSLFGYAPGLTQTSAQAAISVLTAFACWTFDASESNGAAPIRSFLANSGATFIGSRSYAIYLTHWPVTLAVYAMAGGVADKPALFKLGVLLAGIASGIVLAQTVERPLRLKKATPPTTKAYRTGATAGLILTSAFSGVFGIYALSKNNAVPKDVDSSLITLDQLKQELRTARDNGMCNISADRLRKIARLGKCFKRNKPNILIVGDSVADASFVGLARHRSDINFIFISRPGCPPYFGENQKVIASLLAHYEQCKYDSEFVWKIIYQKVSPLRNVDGVLMSGNWNDAMPRGGFAFDNLKALQDYPVPVGFVGVRPQYSESPLRLYQEGKIGAKSGDDMRRFLIGADIDRQPALNRALKKAAGRYPNIDYIDVFSVLCPKACPAFTGKNILYRDHLHLSLAGADYIANSGAFDAFLNKTAGLPPAKERKPQRVPSSKPVYPN